MPAAVALPGVAYAEANWGRWVARCPAPYCDNAMALEPGQAVFGCGGLDACGFTAPVEWPADPGAVEALLTMRPAVKTRNWLPGETLMDLLAENAAHGVLPRAWLELEDTTVPLMLTVEERVVGGLVAAALPGLARVLAQIGA